MHIRLLFQHLGFRCWIFRDADILRQWIVHIRVLGRLSLRGWRARVGMEYHGLKVLCEGWQTYIFDERIAIMQRNQCRVSRTMHIETVSRATAVIKRRGVLSRLASISLGLLLVPFWCGEGSAAESASAAPAVPTAKLLFKSNFGPGVTLGEPSGGERGIRIGPSSARTVKHGIPGR